MNPPKLSLERARKAPKNVSGPYCVYSKPRFLGVSRVGGGAALEAALEAFSEEGFGGRVAAENWPALRLAPSGGKKRDFE